MLDPDPTSTAYKTELFIMYYVLCIIMYDPSKLHFLALKSLKHLKIIPVQKSNTNKKVSKYCTLICLIGGLRQNNYLDPNLDPKDFTSTGTRRPSNKDRLTSYFDVNLATAST